MKDRSEQRPRILIGHNDLRAAKTLQRILENDYELFWAQSSTDLLKEAAETPELILIDDELPFTGGYELCRELKQRSDTRSIPVLILRSESSPFEEARVFDEGATDFLDRPIVSSTALARIKICLELRRLRELTSTSLSLDPLTEVADTRGVREFIDIEWSRAAREATSISLILLAVDHFDGIAKSRGRLAGDECLLQISTEITSIIRRPMDFLGRNGEAGFAIVLPATEAYGAVHLADTIRQQVETLNIPNPASSTKWTTISVGVATAVPFPGSSPEPLIKAAKKALQDARERGGDQYCQVEPKFD